VVWSRDLGLTYTDWEQHAQQVWLTGDAVSGYRFKRVQVGGDTATCQVDDSCGTVDRIEYVGGDGKKYAATVEPYHPPLGSPRVVTRTPYEGAPVTLSAGGFAPPSSVGTVTYSWQFQRAGCSLTCLDYDGPVTGSQVTHTWKGDGTFDVRLTATDSLGQRSVTSLPVTVAGIAPRLTVYPACSPTVTTTCNHAEGTAGATTTLWASVAHTFADENERVTVDWGDGTSATAVHGPDGLSSAEGPLDVVRFGATGATTFMVTSAHVYAASGTYHASVTVTDGTHHTVTESFTEHVEDPPAP
jgi:hypothetical protein